MIKPQKLQTGDKVATVSLSWGGPGTFPHRYEAGKQQLQDEFGVTVVEMPYTMRDAEWLWRNPEARAADLMQAFADPSIKAIFSTIGGDDSIRTLPYVDLDVIRNNPKIFMGYSDTTVTHLVCYKAGLVSFHGPAIMAGFGENGGMFPYMVDSVRRTLFSTEPVGVITPNTDGWTSDWLDWSDPSGQSHKRKLNPSEGWRFLQGQGVRQGHLIGGCLDVFDWLRGTTVWPEPEVWQDAILFLEVVKEGEDMLTPNMVKYILRTYASLGILWRLSGLLFGRPGGPIPPEKSVEYDEAILHIIAEEEGLMDLPIIAGMDFGHTDPMFVIPYGVRAEIDCDQQQFSIVESAVTT